MSNKCFTPTQRHHSVVFVCVSDTSLCSIKMDRRIELGFFGRRLPLTYLCCKENSNTCKTKILPFGTLSKNSGLTNFATSRHCSQRFVNLARQKWTLSVINWTGVSRTKLTILATVDSQFVSMSIQSNLQHDACEAARRVGLSATGDTCGYVQTPSLPVAVNLLTIVI